MTLEMGCVLPGASRRSLRDLELGASTPGGHRVLDIQGLCPHDVSRKPEPPGQAVSWLVRLTSSEPLRCGRK